MKRNSRLLRRIYEQYYGTIPIDEEGRTYDIHHKDGDYTNNHYFNLVAKPRSQHISDHMHERRLRKNGMFTNIKSQELNTEQLRALIKFRKNKLKAIHNPKINA